jgi:hypothetical protein
MSDDTFRPRRPISQEEINQSTSNIDNEIKNNRENAVQITGNVPEAFKQAVLEQRNPNSPPIQKFNDMRVTGSSKLEELIAGIATRGNVIYEKI